MRAQPPPFGEAAQHGLRTEQQDQHRRFIAEVAVQQPKPDLDRDERGRQRGG